MHVQHRVLHPQLVGLLLVTECPESTKKGLFANMLRLQHICVDDASGMSNNELVNNDQHGD